MDEDEVEFLDSVLESTRKKEEEVKKETSEQLDLFRRQQEEKDKELLEGGEEAEGKAGSPTTGESQSSWAVNARKRKKVKENEKAGLKGLKLRKSSSTGEAPVKLNESSSTGEVLKVSTKEVDHKRSAEPQDTRVETHLTRKANLGASTSSPSPPPPKTATMKASPKQENSPRSVIPNSAGLGLAGYSSEDD